MDADKILAEEEALRAQGIAEGSPAWASHMRAFEANLGDDAPQGFYE